MAHCRSSRPVRSPEVSYERVAAAQGHSRSVISTRALSVVRVSARVGKHWPSAVELPFSVCCTVIGRERTRGSEKEEREEQERKNDRTTAGATGGEEERGGGGIRGRSGFSRYERQIALVCEFARGKNEIAFLAVSRS